MTKSTAPVRVIEETPAYRRVLFDYPPFNIVDATIFEGLQNLLARMGASPPFDPDECANVEGIYRENIGFKDRDSYIGRSR